MNRAKILKYLVIYYGVIQLLHLVLNIFPLFINTYYYVGILSEKLSTEARSMMLVSSAIDFFISSPAGIIFSYLWLKGKKQAKYFAIISLAAAGISAVYYEYILLNAHAWELTPINIIFHLAFVPVIVMASLLITD